jgi:hypothetical protein
MIGLVTTAVKSVRFWGLLGAISGLAAVGAWGFKQVYNAGYNASEVKWQTQQILAIDQAVAEARSKWQIAANAAQAEIKIETKIVEKIRIVEREVPRIVETTVLAECRDLGPDIQRLFNDAILAGSGNEAGSPGSPPDPDS